MLRLINNTFHRKTHTNHYLPTERQLYMPQNSTELQFLFRKRLSSLGFEPQTPLCVCLHVSMYVAYYVACHTHAPC